MIPYGHHDIDEGDVAAVSAVLRGEWLTTGPVLEQFETDLRGFTGGTPVVAVSSGTAALHVAYAAAGVGRGDEVITPPMTFIATQATAVALGATIVFADVCPDTANIDPRAVEAAISSRTKAIVAVDYAGHPADMDALRAIADRHGLILIEDAAHSLGSTYKGRPVGSLADITAFSFFPTKNITTAEGGAVAVRDPATLQRAREFARQGLVRDVSRHRITGEGPWHQEVHAFGLNYRLPDVLAALGSSQLTRLAAFKARRADVKASHDAAFADRSDLDIPVQRPDVDPMWHLYPLRVPADLRRAVFERLRAAGVGVQVNYLPAYWHPAFADLGFPRGLCPVAEAFYGREISLPMSTTLTDEQVAMVGTAVIASLRP
ncbi:MAG: aminotransferase class I/II-fold pyridoxal phosphate-dependent enzyme [Actinomycetota bacterium]|nr:aminotransferase class I/II-fold pyridoxal phosphate-dependent enzyme [Actinomycetota bacterium]